MANLVVLHTLRTEIASLETILHQEVKLSSEFRILKTTPGLRELLAATIMLETGSITRFPGVGHFSSYCRCVESKRISNGKKKGEGMPRTATSISPGRSSRPQRSRCEPARRRGAFMNARRRSACRWSR
jgi:transposase